MQFPRVWSKARGVSPLLACVGVVLVGIGACQRDKLPTQSPASPVTKGLGIARSQSIVRGSHHVRPAESRFVQLANEIPGFAGYYIEAGSGQLVAYVKDSTKGFAAAAGALSAHLATDGLGLPPRVRPSTVRIRKADYDFQTLSDYRDIVSDSILGLPGVVSVDLDEQINRVTIGIETSKASQARPLVLDRLRQYGIPIAAVNLKQAARVLNMVAYGSPPVTKTRRYDSILESGSPDTLAAGLPYYDKLANGLCTVGAVVDSGSTRLFMSASHCTKHMFHLNGDTILTYLYGTLIGVERGDREHTGHACNIVFCWDDRSSDAAIFSFSSGLVPNRKGVIARPGTRSQLVLNAARDTSINSSHPWLFVRGTAAAGDLASGETIDKVGMRAGWTYGTITGTCVDVLFDNSDNGDGYQKTYCEAEADGLGSRRGDSGGPIFIWDGYDGATLIGTMTACAGSTGFYYRDPVYIVACTGSFFSYWSANEYDQGTFDALNNTTVGTPSVSGSLDGSGNPVLSWSAVSTTNTTATTTYYVNRSVWDASTYTWTEEGHYIGVTTSTSYTDAGPPLTMTSYAGGTQPAECVYTYSYYSVTAYNQGAASTSSVVYFQGAANGPYPNERVCS